MPFPANAIHLIEPSPTVNPHVSWAAFTPFCWFRVRGYREAAAALQQRAGVPITSDTVKQFRAVALKNVPAPLHRLYPAGEWLKLAPQQIDSAYNREPLRFDKACLAIAAPDQCGAQLAAGQNPLANVRICPATFLLEGF